MKINVRTLRGGQFKVDVTPDDSVADVKKKIESKLGSDTSAYPASQQILIHQKKVLTDTEMMHDVSENSDFITMLSKAPPTTSTLASASASASSEPAPSRDAIERVKDVGAGRWEWEDAERALRAAHNDLSQAVTDLMGITHQEEEPVPSAGPNANQGIPDQQPEPVPSAGPNANQFHALRAMVQTNPHILQPMLQELKKQKPNLAGLIDENQADLLDLICQPVKGDEGELSSVTNAEREAMTRLEALGFSETVVQKVFLACNKDEELATKYLDFHRDT